MGCYGETIRITLRLEAWSILCFSVGGICGFAGGGECGQQTLWVLDPVPWSHFAAEALAWLLTLVPYCMEV